MTPEEFSRQANELGLRVGREDRAVYPHIVGFGNNNATFLYENRIVRCHDGNIHDFKTVREAFLYAVEVGMISPDPLVVAAMMARDQND